MHPMRNFQYYRAYVTSVDSIRIPRHSQEALQQPNWAAAVKEEIHALQKNATWEHSKYCQRERIQSDANGFSQSSTILMEA